MSVCLNCKFSSLNSNEHRVLHDVFMNIGTDLPLAALVKKYLHINVQQSEDHKICDDCLNHLIQLFDLDDHDTSQERPKSIPLVDTIVHNDLGKDDYSNIIYVDTNQWDSGYNSSAIVDNELPIAEYDDTANVDIASDDILTVCDDNNTFTNNNSTSTDAILFNNEDHTESLVNDNQSFCEDIIIEELHSTSDQQIDDVNLEKFISNSDYSDNNLSQSEDDIYFEIIDSSDVSQLSQNEVNASNVIIERPCSNDYDIVDTTLYLNQVLTTQFEHLELQWKIVCMFCNCTLNTLNETLHHACAIKENDESNMRCLISNCNIEILNRESLARHLVLKHFDKLGSLQIYGSCPECGWTFSNFILYNKHSCSRYLKRRPGVMNFCSHCNLEFPSFKRYSFHMQFHLHKYRPKMCLICEAAFNNSNDFFVHVQYNHEPENTIACIECDRFFKNNDAYESHRKRHESQVGYYCAHCTQKYEHRHNLLDHMEVYHNRKVKRIRCEHCNKVFLGNKSYHKHLQFHSQMTEVQSYICTNCGLVYCTHDDAINYDTNSSICCATSIKETILAVTYYCENCGLDYESVKNLCEHRSSSEHNDETFSCPLCKKLFNEFRCVRSHMKTHKNYRNWLTTFPVRRLYVCNIGNCQDIYPVWSSLYYHKKRPHPKYDDSEQFIDVYVCQFCKKKCPTKMSLAVHVARSHNTKNKKCPHCKNTCKNDRTLQKHIDNMHTPIQCDICFKIIKNQRNYRTHINIVHKRTQRYHCTKCTKGFYHKSELVNHLKHIHTDIVYKCNKCCFTTNYKTSLDIHVAKHDNKMAFQCNFCTKAFTRKPILQMHIKRHHRNKEFKCEAFIESGCELAFATRRDLYNHIKRKHKNLEYKKPYDCTNNKSNISQTKTDIPDVNDVHDDAYEDYYNDLEEDEEFDRECISLDIDSDKSYKHHYVHDNNNQNFDKETDVTIEYLDEYSDEAIKEYNTI